MQISGLYLELPNYILLGGLGSLHFPLAPLLIPVPLFPVSVHKPLFANQLLSPDSSNYKTIGKLYKNSDLTTPPQTVSSLTKPNHQFYYY